MCWARSMQATRALVSGLLLAGASGLLAQEPDANARWAQVLHRGTVLNEQGQPAACLAHLQDVKPQLEQLHIYLRLAWMGTWLICQAELDHTYFGQSDEQKRVSVDALVNPLIDEAEATGHFDRQGILRLQWQFNSLRDVRALAEARALLYGVISGQLRLAVRGDASARTTLGKHLEFFHGSWTKAEELRTVHALFVEALGVKDPLTLRAQRQLAYVEGYLGNRDRSRALTRAAWVAAQSSSEAAQLLPHLALDMGAALADENAPEALDFYRQSLGLFEAQPDPKPVNVARALTHIALVEIELGEFDEAVHHAERGSELLKVQPEQSLRQESIFIGAIASAARLLRGDADGAQRLKQSLEGCTTAEMHAGQLAALLALHAVRVADTALLQWSRAFLDDNLARFRPPLHADRAVQAWLTHRQGEDALAKAWAIALPSEDGSVRALIEFELARQARDKQAVEAAIWHGKRGALALTQRGADPDAASSLPRGAAVRHEPELQALASDLIQAGRLAEADQALRLLHDEELRSYRRASRNRVAASSVAISMTALEQRWDLALRPLQDQLAHIHRESASRFDKIGHAGPRHSYREPADLTAQFSKAVESLQTTLLPQAPARQESGPDVDLHPARLPAHQARLILLPQGNSLHALIQRWDGPPRNVAWPVNQQQLAVAVQAHRQVLAVADADARPASQALFKLVLAPLLRHLKGVRQISIAAEGVLRYVSFSALHDGKRWSTERWALVNEAHPTQAQAPALRHWLAAGRSNGDARHAALPAVEREMDALQRLGAHTLRDTNFNAERLKQALAQQPDVVHLASHYRFDPVSETRSYLLLGSGEQLSLPELRDLPWRGVQLVVLSACESGVPVAASLSGQTGREWLGLTDGLHRAGVANVVATQWRVDDQASAELMAAFHQDLARERRAQPEVLARTQRLWLRQHRGQPLAHPHYWAGYAWFRG